jgi:phage shock protein A
MNIFSRLVMLFRSNVNHAIGKAENPEKMLNQLLMDMSTQLVENKKAVAMAIADEKQLERQLETQKTQASEWENKAILAIKAGKDELAKEALVRKQEYDTATAEYKKHYDVQHAAVEKLKGSLRDLQSRIDEASRKKNLLIARAKRAEAQQQIQTTMSSLASNRGGLEAFSRMEEKITQLEAEAEAAIELDENLGQADLERQFKELQSMDNGADKMLLELKAKMASGELPEDKKLLIEGAK